MKHALLIHGAYGSPTVNWLPWLSQELSKLGYLVSAPQFPTPENQSLATWNNIAQPYLANLSNDSIIIGHSIGATFVLRLLEQLNQPINLAGLVAGFASDLPDENLNLINQSFYQDTFNWDRIQQNARNILVFHSHDDPYVPMILAQQMAQNLNQTVINIPQAGHFNSASGYNKFPELLNRISKSR